MSRQIVAVSAGVAGRIMAQTSSASRQGARGPGFFGRIRNPYPKSSADRSVAQFSVLTWEKPCRSAVLTQYSDRAHPLESPSMAVNRFSDALHYLRRLCLPEQVVGLTDADLAGRFVKQRDAAAFEALLLRHGPMIW